MLLFSLAAMVSFLFRAPFGQGVLDVLAFSEPPTGVKVAKLIVTSEGSSAELKWLRLRLDNEGCNPDEGKTKFR